MRAVKYHRKFACLRCFVVCCCGPLGRVVAQRPCKCAEKKRVRVVLRNGVVSEEILLDGGGVGFRLLLLRQTIAPRRNLKLTYSGRSFFTRGVILYCLLALFHVVDVHSSVICIQILWR